MAVVRRIAAIFTLALFAQGAGADDLIPPDPWEVVHKVRALGTAEVGRDDFRDPVIRAELSTDDDDFSKLRYEVSFYGCDLGRDCTSILLSLRLFDESWGRQPPAKTVFATWNREKLVGRAWRDPSGRAVLDHAVIIGRGIPPQMLERTLAAWATAMREFADHIDFPGK